jgi:hypothetical protein
MFELVIHDFGVYLFGQDRERWYDERSHPRLRLHGLVKGVVVSLSWGSVRVERERVGRC